MSSHREYETLYGVGLLDDLHNYFPALLYDPSSFHSAGDVMLYVQEQTRNRFDLFSLGQRDYRSRAAPAPAPAPASASASPSPSPSASPSASAVRSTNPLSSDISENRPTGNSILQPTNLHFPSPSTSPYLLQSRTPTNRTFNTAIEYMWNVIPEPEEEIPITSQLLSALMNLPLNRNYNMPLRNAGLDAFMQPVLVCPTPEQITANTTVGNLVSDEDHDCAICQDILNPEQEGRKLNACGHWFHKDCIDTWFERNVHCPVCRHDIREPISQAPQ